MNSYTKIPNCKEPWDVQDLPNWDNKTNEEKKNIYNDYRLKCEQQKYKKIDSCPENYPVNLRFLPKNDRTKKEDYEKYVIACNKLNPKYKQLEDCPFDYNVKGTDDDENKQMYEEYTRQCQMYAEEQEKKSAIFKQKLELTEIQNKRIREDDYKLIAIIWELYNNNNIPQDSTSIEYRTLFNLFRDRNLIETDLDCDDFSRVIEIEKVQHRTTASPTRIWLSNAISNTFNTSKKYINDEKVSQLFALFNRMTGIQCGRDVSDRLTKLINGTIGKLKKNYVLKLAITKTDEDPQVRENYFYKFLSRLVYNNNTPHIVTHMNSYTIPYEKCEKIFAAKTINVEEKMDVKIKGTLTQENKISKNLKELIDTVKPPVEANMPMKYTLLFTEAMTNAKDWHTWLQNMCINGDDIENIMNSFLTQVVYTAQMFSLMNMVHNDFHKSNIYLEKMQETKDFYYVIPTDPLNPQSKCKVIKLTTQYFVWTFDFDRSYIIGDPKYDGNIFNPDIWPDIFTGDRNDELAHDLNYIMFNIQTQTNKLNCPPENNNPPNSKRILDAFNTFGFDQYADYKSVAYPNRAHELMLKHANMEISALDLVSDRSRVFFYPTLDIDYLIGEFSKNDKWNRLSLYEKILVCNPLIKKQDIKKINQTDFCGSQTVSVHLPTEPQTVSFHLPTGSQTGGNNLYYEKYMKYKTKYINKKI